MKAFIVCATLALVLCSVSAKPSSRIVGGEDASPDAAPFIVSLQWATETRRQHFCAGAIIDSHWVLTAAHCIGALPKESLIKIVAGKTNLRFEDNHEQVRQVESYIVHEDFTGGISSNDIALLRVAEPFEWTDSVKAIDLPRTKDLPRGASALYGWGSVSTDFMPEFPDTLQTVVTDILPYAECEEVLGGEGATPLDSKNICTGPLEGGVSACNGDSGGPLVKNDAEGNPTLIGLVSWGFYPCGGANTPSIYVNVASYLEWIHQKME